MATHSCEWAPGEMEKFLLKRYQLDKPHNTPIIIPWVPATPHEFSDPQFPAFSFRAAKNVLFGIVTQSIPPFLSKTYHCSDITGFMVDEDSWFVGGLYFTWASCLTMFNEAFGIPLYRAINAEVSEATEKVPDLFQLEEEKSLIMCDTLAALQMVTRGYVAPVCEKLFAPKASDFMLEPCVLIQLPWKPVVLQQWLLGGLAEVLVFERDSTELRHWPLPEETKECSTQILSLVRDLKSRLVLGFAILARMVHTHPDHDPKFHQYLLEDVVLPSVPVLTFLISGKATEIVRNIKRISWSTPDSWNRPDSCPVPPSAYLMDKDLENYHLYCFFSIFSWSQKSFEKIYHDPPFDIQEMALKIKNQNYVQDDKSVQEKELKSHLQQNWPEIKTCCYDNEEVVAKTCKFIETNLIESGIFPKLTVFHADKVFFEDNEAEDKVDEIFSDGNNLILSSVLQVMLYEQANSFGCRLGGKSVICQLIAIQVKSLQREQIVKLTSGCSKIFNMTPQLKFQVDAIVTQSKLSKEISDVRTKIKTFTKTKLFSQLPSTWSGKVSGNEPYITYTPKSEVESNARPLVAAFQKRIGKLVYGIAETNFKAVAAGAQPYPYFNTVQYLLPSFLASFVSREGLLRLDYELNEYEGEGANDTTNFQPEMTEFVHTLILYFETSYVKWSTDLKPTPKTPERIDNEDFFEAVTYYRSFSMIVKKYHEFVRHFLQSHTERGVAFNSEIKDLDNALHYFTNWAIDVTSCDFVNRNMFPCLNAWNESSYTVFKQLFHIFQKSFHHAIPGEAIGSIPELDEINFACAVIIELEIVFELASKIKGVNEDAVDLFRKEIPISDSIYVDVKTYVNSLIVQRQELDSNKLKSRVQLLAKLLLEIYQGLKKFRRNCDNVSEDTSLYDKFPYADNPRVHAAVTAYIKGDLDSLDRMMTVFKIPQKKVCFQCKAAKKLTPCAQCVEQRYPDVNYFCSKRCKEARLKRGHDTEHSIFQEKKTKYSLNATE